MLKIEYLPLSEIIPYSGNAKIHSDLQVELIAKSIQDYGFNDPVAICNGVLVEGHGRLMAARKLGMDKIPVIRLDGLTDEQRRAYTLVHNQLNMSTGFDIETLNLELEELEMDLSEYGFEFEETFSIDEIEEVNGYNASDDNRDYFEKTFTFPISKKKQIISYLKKHQNEIVQRIIEESEA